MLLRKAVDRRRRQAGKLDHVERDALRLASLAELRQRQDGPARRVVGVVGIAANVIDAVALEMLQALKVSRRALAAEDGTRLTCRCGCGRLAREGRANPRQAGESYEVTSFHG